MSRTLICDGETYEVIDKSGEKFRLRIVNDDFAESPREWYNISTMVCWHRRYNLGDKHDYADPEEFYQDLVRKYVLNKSFEYDDLSISACRELVKEYVEVRPLYLFDHSGITISTSDFGDRWDSGQVGVVYVSKKKIFNEGLSLPYLDENGNKVRIEYKHENAPSTYGYKRIPADKGNWREIARHYIDSEVELYDKYLRGDVYGFILEKKTSCDHCGHEEWEEVDSCYGFYGDTLEESGILDECGCALKI